MADIQSEIETRKAHRDIIAALFKSRPLAEIEPAELRTITTHYQQRISECRRELGMVITNVARTGLDASGRAKKLDGAYRYQPHGDALGRDASQPTKVIEWPTTHGRPFQEDFRLT